MRSWLPTLAVLIVMAALILIANRQQAEQIQAACVRDKNLSSYVRKSAERGLKSLPTIAYYKDHPGELARAKDQLREQIKAFPPLDC